MAQQAQGYGQAGPYGQYASQGQLGAYGQATSQAGPAGSSQGQGGAASHAQYGATAQSYDPQENYSARWQSATANEQTGGAYRG